VARSYRPVDREQPFLLPPSMTDWLPEDHLVWFVIEAVTRMDTAAFHARARLGGVGRRGYDPDMLLTLLVYAMAQGVRSSRRIEQLCHTDVAFRIICASDVPDHTVLARFRQDHEAALADLLTATLLLCAELGMVRLGVVAFDGVKIAANAALDANRTEAGLRRLAQAHLAATAATDAAQDALLGAEERGDELPERLRDRTHRGRRIGQALDEIAAREPATPAARPDPVRAAYDRWQRERVRAQQRIDAWQAKADAAAAAGRKLPGSRPAPVDEQLRVRRAHTAYQRARAAADHPDQPPGPNQPPGPEPRANLTDPDSRLLKTRNGWIQGYNCQTATSDDQFIIHADATQDANDVHQFQPTMHAVTATASDLTHHTGRDDLTIGVMIGDAGYDSDTNLTSDGPDRLIALTNRHRLATRAKTNPATGDPPAHATPRQRMDHRLRTPHGHQLYKRRSPIAETPHAWLKDGRGLRQFLRRGLTAARSELRLAAAVTNLLRLRTLGVTTTRLATA
jgi:transposase